MNDSSAIIYPSTADVPALKALWRLCFPDDSSVFVDYYFENIFVPEESLIFTFKNRPVAFLQMIPYRVKSRGCTLDAAYLSGVMTHPNFRNRGIVSRLLNFSFEIMRKREYSLTFLIPQEDWLKGFYARFGFDDCFQRNKFVADTIVDTGLQEPTLFSMPDPCLYKAYSRLLSLATDVVLKTEEQFEHILWDFFGSGGIVFASPNSVAFVKNNGEHTLIKELLAVNNHAHNEMIDTVGKHFGAETTLVEHAPFHSASGIKGMSLMLDEKLEQANDLYISMMLSE